MMPICLKQSPTSCKVTSSPSPWTKMVLLSELSGSSPAKTQTQKSCYPFKEPDLWDGVIRVGPYRVHPGSRSLESLENTGEDERQHLRPRNRTSYCSNNVFILILAMHINKTNQCLQLSGGCFHTGVPHTNTLRPDYFQAFGLYTKHKSIQMLGFQKDFLLHPGITSYLQSALVFMQNTIIFTTHTPCSLPYLKSSQNSH